MCSIRERVEWAKLNNVRYLFDLSFFEVDRRLLGYSTMAGREGGACVCVCWGSGWGGRRGSSLQGASSERKMRALDGNSGIKMDVFVQHSGVIQSHFSITTQNIFLLELATFIAVTHQP